MKSLTFSLFSAIMYLISSDIATID